MRFPAEFVDRLRGHFLLSEVIGKRVPIKRHGREYMACCPFHKEKTPSFTINDEKGFYHCFGCGAHGDAIGFVKEYEGISYPEAIERLAQDAGMPLPVRSAEDDARAQAVRGLHEAMEAAAQWFCAQLETSAALPVREYLASRGIGREMIAQFRIGFAPPAREALRAHLLGKGFSEQILLDGGLLIASDRGLPFSRFHDRLMFPIGDRHGKVIAFGGRVLPHATATTGMASAKYINSPETPLFHKGHVLYNFAPARKAARDAQRVVVAEGYMDVVALAQAGVPEAVAPLGTAMTEHHLRALWQTVPEPILCLDGDAAGQRAMWRAAELALPLMAAGQGLRFALLPDKHDPDSLLREQGAGAVQSCLKAAMPLSEAIWNHMRSEHPPTTAEASARLEHALMEMVERATDATIKRHFRQYFIDQLRAARPAAQRQNHALYTPQRRGTMVGGKLTPPPSPNAGVAVRQVAGAALGMLSEQGPRQHVALLIAAAPWLLLSAEVEDALHRIFPKDAVEMQWLASLEQCAHTTPDAPVAEWVAALSPAARQLLQSAQEHARTRLPKPVLEAASSPHHTLVFAAWRHAMLGVEMQQLQDERQRISQNPGEDAYTQLLHLQQRLLQVESEHQRLQKHLTGEV